MQINIEVFYKLILSLLVSVTRHVQSTQNKFAYLCNISIKAWRMELIFCLQINIKVLYKTIVSLSLYIARHAQKVAKTTGLQYLCNMLRKMWRMKLIFCLLINVEGFFKVILSFQVCVIRHVDLGVCGQAMSILPKITSLLFLCSILRKKWVMQLIFYMQISMKACFKLLL